MNYKRNFGILLGAMYGMIYRFLCEKDVLRNSDLFDFNIYNVSFVWVLPIVIGVIPILVLRDEIVDDWWKQFTYPIYSVIAFFIFALSSGLEDWLCLLILVLPFILVAGFTGLIIGYILKKIDARKLYSILFLPLIIMPIESQFENQKETFEIQHSIIINAEKKDVWNYLIEVPEIKSSEYDDGFFNYIGIPRPVKSQLEIINGEEYRVGYFSDDLKLYEKITKVDSLNFVNFQIDFEKSEFRDLPTDKHLLQSDYFKFDDIAYRLEMLDNRQTKLSLSCSYTMESKMNGYANFWATKIVTDFEVKLLKVLKGKVEDEVQ